MDFNKLKAQKNNFDRLLKEVEKINSGYESNEDTRFWYPEVDKTGNGVAIIRFLDSPAVDGEDGVPFVRLFKHFFKGPTGRVYAENSRTTLGNLPDPISEYNKILWNHSNDENSPERKQAREQKRRLTYISNIYVISDPKNPENEGKVFLFNYGKKIFDKIQQLLMPEFEGETPINVFDFWEGANFKMKIRTVDGYRNYDLSTFDRQSPLFKDDAKIEAVWKESYSLKEIVDPKNFKSYEELKEKLDAVLGFDFKTGVPANVQPRQTTHQIASQQKKPAKVEDDVEEDVEIELDSDDDDEETMNYLKSLV